MSGSIRLMLMILAVVFVGYIGYHIVVGLIEFTYRALVSLIVPLAIVGALALGFYTMINRRALGPGRRTLP